MSHDNIQASQHPAETAARLTPHSDLELKIPVVDHVYVE